jgi:hypothetical protein
LVTPRQPDDAVEVRVLKFTPRSHDEFSRSEIRRLRKYLTREHGNGPRAQQRISEAMEKALTATKAERAVMRKEREW